MCHRLILGTLIGCLAGAAVSRAADWPTYRADAARSGLSAEQLPGELALHWVRPASPGPRPAWYASDRIHFDLVDHPIVVGGLVIQGSSAGDRVVALDLQTGRPRWTFFTAGPVRFAPAAGDGRVFVASDDGHLDALALDDGRLLWKHRAGPDARQCLGNERMISRWPVRGGPVLVDDVVYFAAGIWPSDGVIVRALRADSGAVVWSNESSGGLEMAQPHGGAWARSGVAPQGYLVASDTLLFAPTGRAVPAAFERAGGAFRYYHLEANHSIGGSRALLADAFLANGDCLFHQDTGKIAARCGRGVLTPTRDGLVQAGPTKLVLHRWAEQEATDRKGNTVKYRGLARAGEVVFDDRPLPESIAAALKQYPHFADLWDLNPQFAAVSDKVLKQSNLEVALAQRRPELQALGVSTEPFLAGTSEKSGEAIVAGSEAIVGQDGLVRIVDLDGRKIRWTQAVEGTALGLAVAHGRLLVSTTQGLLYCFGAPAAAPAKVAAITAEQPPTSGAEQSSPAVVAAAEEVLARSGRSAGLCIDLGCDEGQLALELARRSQLQICCLESDPAKVQRARQRLAAAGLFGTRVSVQQGDPARPPYPAACADLVVAARQLLAGDAVLPPATMLEFARPHGGKACTGRAGNLHIAVRPPLPGAGQWTHQNADPANTLCSGDQRVKGPLEMRWFRDVDFEITDRHAQGPAPLTSDGVLVVEGVNGLCAVDAYNGRTLWTYSIPGILRDQDGVHHDVGVGDTGGNFCLGDGSVYVAVNNTCLRLDLYTGAKLSQFATPAAAADRDRAWGYIAYHDGRLYGSILNDAHYVSPRYAQLRLRTESSSFFALDPQTERLLWHYRANDSIRNNAIAIAGTAVYLIDRVLSTADEIAEPKPNGKHKPVLKPGEHPGGVLLALDAATGEPLWRQTDDVFGTQLAVSQPHHRLLMYYQAVLHNFFKLPSEVGGRMAAFDTRTGERVWDREAKPKTRPAIIGDTIYAQGGAWDVATGEERPFTFKRTHGCGQIAGGACTLLFRSATLAYLDLTANQGTQNFGGIRPGCWINAIPAAGLALVPDGSSKCACSYQMHAWLALQPQAATP